MSDDIPATSYSTIFHCGEGFFICFLRALEGVISLALFIVFMKGYRVFSKEQNNRLSNQDKNLYILAMTQTGLTTLYFLLFEEFFMLATVRNFLIWISINMLEGYIHLNYGNEEGKMKIGSVIVNALKLANFLLWFFISLGDGSSLINTDFNLGYNCKIPDWMFLSGLLVIITMAGGFLGYNKVERLIFDKNNIDKTDIRKIKEYNQSINTMIIQIASSILGALIMFFWDYFAYVSSTSKQSCEALFSGDTAFRNMLCFLLKIISMQLNPTAIYYMVYYSRKDTFNQTFNEQKRASQFNYFDDAASQLNRTLTSVSRGSERVGSMADRDRNASQYL